MLTNSHQWLQLKVGLLIVKVPRHIPQILWTPISITKLPLNQPEINVHQSYLNKRDCQVSTKLLYFPRVEVTIKSAKQIVGDTTPTNRWPFASYISSKVSFTICAVILFHREWGFNRLYSVPSTASPLSKKHPIFLLHKYIVRCKWEQTSS